MVWHVWITVINDSYIVHTDTLSVNYFTYLYRVQFMLETGVALDYHMYH